MFQMSKRTALVTGASGGIGSAIARALHNQGATIAITGRNEKNLHLLAKNLGERTHVFIADLEDPENLNSLIGEVNKTMGSLDILVNNAGHTRDALMMRMSDEDWWDVININLTAAFKLSRAALRGMIRAKYGRIINITSVVAQTGNSGQTNYVASKAGLVGMTKSLATEVASRGITVNCVAPGFVSTKMTESLTDVQQENLLKKIPMARFGVTNTPAATTSGPATTPALASSRSETSWYAATPAVRTVVTPVSSARLACARLIMCVCTSINPGIR